MPEKFVLIGSGLAGGLLAAYLGRRGYEVELYERRGDPREGNMVGGRSINLALSTRGIYALEQLGIADEVLRHAIPMRGRMIHDKSGNLHFSPYDRDPNKFINSIGRAALNTTVIEAAQRQMNPARVGKGAKGQSVVMGRGRSRSGHLRDGEKLLH